LQNQQKKYPQLQKLSGKLRGTSLKVKVFTPTPVEYKSIELDYKLPPERPKKAVKGHTDWPAASAQKYPHV